MPTSTIPSDNDIATESAATPVARQTAISLAIERLEDLAIGSVEEFDSYDDLEAGCLSCSGVKSTNK